MKTDDTPFRADLDLALDAAGVGVWEYDHAADRSAWSPALCALLGYAAAQVPKNLVAWLDLVHPDDVPNLQARVAAALTPDNPRYAAEYRLYAADGRWVWVDARGRVAQRDVAGQPLLTLGTMIDISERKHAELLLQSVALEAADQRQALREREEIYGAIFSQAGDGIALVDAQTLRFVEVNDAGCRLLGYSRDEMLRLSAPQLRADQDEAGLRARVAQVQAREQAHFENRYRRKDGTLLDLQIDAQNVHLHGRDYMVAVWRDIGERKRIDAELAQYRRCAPGSWRTPRRASCCGSRSRTRGSVSPPSSSTGSSSPSSRPTTPPRGNTAAPGSGS